MDKSYEKIMSPINFVAAGWLGAVAVEMAMDGELAAVGFGAFAISQAAMGINKINKLGEKDE